MQKIAGSKLVCTFLEPRSELVGTGMFWYALVCTGMYLDVMECTCMYLYVLVCTATLWYVDWYDMVSVWYKTAGMHLHILIYSIMYCT